MAAKKQAAKGAPTAKAGPMTYESVRAPNLRERLRAEARANAEGVAEITPETLNPDQEG